MFWRSQNRMKENRYGKSCRRIQDLCPKMMPWWWKGGVTHQSLAQLYRWEVLPSGDPLVGQFTAEPTKSNSDEHTCPTSGGWLFYIHFPHSIEKEMLSSGLCFLSHVFVFQNCYTQLNISPLERAAFCPAHVIRIKCFCVPHTPKHWKNLLFTTVCHYCSHRENQEE